MSSPSHIFSCQVAVSSPQRTQYLAAVEALLTPQSWVRTSGQVFVKKVPLGSDLSLCEDEVVAACQASLAEYPTLSGAVRLVCNSQTIELVA